MTPLDNSVANLLAAYRAPGTTYTGSTVARSQNSGLVNTGTSESGPMDVFSVFDALTVSDSGVDAAGNRMLVASLTNSAMHPPRPAVPASGWKA